MEVLEGRDSTVRTFSIVSRIPKVVFLLALGLTVRLTVGVRPCPDRQPGRGERRRPGRASTTRGHRVVAGFGGPGRLGASSSRGALVRLARRQPGWPCARPAPVPAGMGAGTGRGRPASPATDRRGAGPVFRYQPSRMGSGRPPRHSPRSGSCPRPIRRRPSPNPARARPPLVRPLRRADLRTGRLRPVFMDRTGIGPNGRPGRWSGIPD
jgi:hypothetical protein